MNNLGTKINIRGSVTDAVHTITTDVIGLFVVVSIFGFLIAPYFANVFENYYFNAYGVKQNVHRYELVQRKMFKIKLGLWCVSIIAWAFVLACFIARQSALL